MTAAALGLVCGLAGCGSETHSAPADPPGSSTLDGLLADEPATSSGAEHQVTTRLRFVDGTSDSGVVFHHEPTRSARKFMPEIAGGGVAMVDINRDGAVDLVLVNSGDMRQADRPEALRNRLFLNDGQGRFTDATDAWGLPSTGYGMGVSAGDVDGDGWTDLLFTYWGRPLTLLRNTGSGFEDITDKAGLGEFHGWSTSAGFFDMNGNGRLDLYVTHYVEYEMETALPCYQGERLGYCTPVLFKGIGDRLYENLGDGRFRDVTDQAGFPEDPGNGLALAIGDVNNDGHMDLYVANDVTRNFLLIGHGDGTFEEVGQFSGVAYSDQGNEEAGMGVAFIDLDGNGLLDIACTNFQGETTSIYVQQDRMFFLEQSDARGVGRTARNRLSFGVAFFDVANNGREDLLVANGHIQDVITAYSSTVTFEQPNTLYENVGERFVDVSEDAGPALAHQAVSRGLAVGDLDHDGRLDYVVVNNGGPAQVAMNRTEPSGAFVNLWLEGVKANSLAIGARVTVQLGEHEFTRQVFGASSFLSVCDRRLHLGLGEAATIDRLTIRWPAGETQTFENLPVNQFYRIVEGGQPEVYKPGEQVIPPTHRATGPTQVQTDPADADAGAAAAS